MLLQPFVAAAFAKRLAALGLTAIENLTLRRMASVAPALLDVLSHEVEQDMPELRYVCLPCDLLCWALPAPLSACLFKTATHCVVPHLHAPVIMHTLISVHLNHRDRDRE